MVLLQYKEKVMPVQTIGASTARKAANAAKSSPVMKMEMLVSKVGLDGKVTTKKLPQALDADTFYIKEKGKLKPRRDGGGGGGCPSYVPPCMIPA